MFNDSMWTGMVMGIFLAGALAAGIVGGIGYGIYWLWTTYDIVPQTMQCEPESQA